MLFSILTPLIRLSHSFLGISKRQNELVFAGPACYSVCDQAVYVFQSVGEVPALCNPQGDFATAMSSVEACTEVQDTLSDNGVTTLVTALGEALSYCFNINSPIDGAAPATTTATPVTTSAAPVTTSAAPASTSTTVPVSISVVVVPTTSVIATTSQAPGTTFTTPLSSLQSSSSTTTSASYITHATQAPQGSTQVSSSTTPTTLKTSSTSTAAMTSPGSRQSSSTSLSTSSTSSQSTTSSPSSTTALPVVAANSDPVSSQHSISTGEVAGIAVGAAAISILIFALIVFFVMRHRKKKRNTTKAETHSGSETRPAAAAIIQEEEKAQLHGDDYRAELSPNTKPASRIRTVGGLEELEWDPSVVQRRSELGEHEAMVHELSTTGSPPPQYVVWSDMGEKEARRY